MKMMISSIISFFKNWSRDAIIGLLFSLVALYFSLRADKFAEKANFIAEKSNVSAEKANDIANKALKIPNIPWLKITGLVFTKVTKDTLQIEADIKNCAQAPALDFKLEFISDPREKSHVVKAIPAILPQDKEHIVINLFNTDVIMKEVLAGAQFPIKFNLNYKDPLNQEHSVIIEYKMSIIGFSIERYSVLK